MTKAFHSFSLFLPLFFCYMPNASLYNFLFSFPYSFIKRHGVYYWIYLAKYPSRAFIFCFFYFPFLSSFLSFPLIYSP